MRSTDGYIVQGGDTGTVSVLLFAYPPPGGAAVALSSSDPAVLSVPASVTIPAGSTSATVTLTAAPVTSTTSVTLTGSYNNVAGTAAAQACTVTVVPPSVFTLSLSPTTVDAGAASTGTVTLYGPAPAGGTTITLTSSSAAATVPASVTVPAGSSTTTFPVATAAGAASASVTVKGAAVGSSVPAQQAGLIILAPPAAPTGLTASAGSGSVALSWTASATAYVTGYSVYRATSSGGPFAVVNASPITGTGYTDGGVTNGTAYFYYVTALSPYGTSAPSNTASATPAAPGPTVATPASASPNPVTGTTTQLSVLGTDAAGESTLTYTWAATGTPPAPVTFSANGTNTAQDTTATFTRAGVYALAVTIKDAAGLTATSAVTVTVQQTPTAVGVSPASASVQPGATQPFVATAADQFGNAIVGPAVTWSVPAAAGTITTGGLFTAGATPGTYTVTATSGGAAGTASVAVPAAVSGLSLSPASVTGGSPSAGTVTLTGPAPAGGTAVALSSSNTSATVPASITVPAGSSSATFTVGTTSVTTATTATVGAAAGGTSQTAALTINPVTTSAIQLNGITNGMMLSGDVTVQLYVPLTDSYNYGDLYLEVDGTPIAVSGDVYTSNSTNNVFSFDFGTDDYSNGSHILTVVDRSHNRTISYSVNFNNDISNIAADDYFDPSSSSLPITATSNGPWTITIVDDMTGNTTRTYTGTNNINVVWDGKDNTGATAPDSSYTITITASAAASQQHATPAVAYYAHKRYSNKYTVGDALFILNKTDSVCFPCGPAGVVAYAQAIRQKIQPYVSAGTIRKPIFLLASAYRMRVPTPKNGNAVDPLVSFINRELATPLRIFYIDSHGGTHLTSNGLYHPYVCLGVYSWYSVYDPNAMLYAGIVNYDIGALVLPAGYGSQGNNPPSIVWIDSCDSAGGESQTDTNNENSDFANDFQSGNLFGIFLGWNGYANGYGVAAPADDWSFWRNDMWTQILNSSQNFTTAYNNVVRDYRYHGYYYTYTNTPEYRARIQGDGSDNMY